MTKKNKLLIISFFLSFLLSIFLIVISINNVDIKKSEEENKIILRLADIYSENHLSHKSNALFAALVKERTNGRIEIILYENGILGDEDNVLEQLEFGGIDFARVSAYSLDKYNSNISMLLLPNLFSSTEDFWNVMDSRIGSKLLSSLEKEGIIGLSWLYSGDRVIYYDDVNVSETDRHKIRIEKSQYLIDLMSCYNVIPIPLDRTEISRALANDYIDGAEGSFLDYFYSSYFKQAQYVFFETYIHIPDVLICSKKTLSKLNKMDQIIIKQCGIEVGLFSRENGEKEEKRIKELLEQNTAITYVDLSLDDDVLDENIKKMCQGNDEYDAFKSLIDTFEKVNCIE